MTINNPAKRRSISDLFLSKSDIVRSKWDIVLLAACLACSQTAFGQEQKAPRGADSLKSIVLNPVVVTGTGTYHLADNSPVSVKVISSKDLQDTHASNLQEALSRLTTNVTTHTNGMGTFVNVNGVSDDYVVILENGKRISGDDRWNRINMANVKRVEIFSGAASALYGSEAIAGVINIITDDSHEPLTASAYTKLMNHGRLQEEINLDVNAGKFSSHTSYGHQQADNWQVNHYQAFDEGGSEVLKLTGRPMSTAFKSDNITEKLEWKFNERWSAYLRGSYYDYRTDRPQKATYFTQKTAKNAATGEKNYTYSERQAYTYDLYHKSYTYGAGARWAPNRRAYLYLDVYSDNFSSKYDYWQTADKEAYDETRKRTHYTDETLRGIFRLAGWNKLSAGLQLIQESLHSQSDNIRFETTATYNVFAQDEIKIAGGLPCRRISRENELRRWLSHPLTLAVVCHRPGQDHRTLHLVQPVTETGEEQLLQPQSRVRQQVDDSLRQRFCQQDSRHDKLPYADAGRNRWRQSPFFALFRGMDNHTEAGQHRPCLALWRQCLAETPATLWFYP